MTVRVVIHYMVLKKALVIPALFSFWRFLHCVGGDVILTMFDCLEVAASVEQYNIVRWGYGGVTV